MCIDLPIRPEQIKTKSLSDKFWGSDPKHNFYAQAKNVVISGQLDRKQLAVIQANYGSDIALDFAHQWKELLEEITYCIAADGRIDSDEKAFFKEYIKLFRISREDAASIYRKGVERAYMDILAKMCEDGELDDDELAKLNKIAKHFGLSEVQSTEAMEQRLGELVQEKFTRMADDGMVSDEEWDSFIKHAKGLRVDFKMDEKTMEIVEFARNRWRIAYGELVPIEPTVKCKLKANEKAYYQGVADWFNMYKNDNGEFHPTRVGKGTLIMTDQRAIFLATVGDNKSFAWNSLHSIRMHATDYFELEKVTGKSPMFKITRTWVQLEGLAFQMAERLLDDA